MLVRALCGDCDCDSFTGKLELSEETERGLSDFGSKVQHLRYLDGSESSPSPAAGGCNNHPARRIRLQRPPHTTRTV